MFKRILLLSFALLLTACQTSGVQTLTQYMPDPVSGEPVVVSVTETVTGKGGVELLKDRELYKGEVDKEKAKASRFEHINDPTAAVAIAAFDKIKPDAALGINTSQYKLGVKQENTRRFGLVAPLLGVAADAYSRTRGGNRDEGAIVLNGDNNSIQGLNTGDNSQVTHSVTNTDFVGGIPLNNADVEPIVLGGPDPLGEECSPETMAANGGICPSGF